MLNGDYIRTCVLQWVIGSTGVGVITLTDIQALCAIIVGLVTSGCTIALTIHTIRKDQRKRLK